MNKKNSLDLTQGSILNVLILFILPIMAGSLIQQLYTTVDAVIVGRFVGKTGLAAIDSVSILFRFPINFLSGLSAGTTIVISAYFGEKNKEALDCSIHTGYSVAILFGIICSVLGVIFSPALIQIMAVPEEIYHSALMYCRIYFAGLGAMTLYNMVAGILRAHGDSKTPFYILIVGSCVNIIGDLILVGALHMGVSGAAIATIAAQIVSAILAVNALKSVHNECSLSVWHIKLYKNYAVRILKIGLPLGLQSILFPIANSIVQANINTMGTDIIAAWAVCSKLELLIWLVADSMSPTLSTYTAQNIGAKKTHRIRKGVLLGAAISFMLVAVISTILFFFSEPLGSLFVTGKDASTLVPMVVYYMKMMAPFYVFYTFAESFSGACCGMGDTLKPMITTLICTCGLRVAAIFLFFTQYHTMECIIWIYIASWVVSGLAFVVMFWRKIRKIQ